MEFLQTNRGKGSINKSHICVVQIQTHSLSKTGAKIVITLNGETKDYSALLAVDGDRRFTDPRTLRVTGTLALKSGWKTSVKIFTRDNNWMAKSSSGFSCHLIKTFDGCTDKQSVQVLAQMFTFVKPQTNHTINRTTRSDVINAVFRPANVAEEFADDAMSVSYSFVHVYLVIAVVIQSVLRMCI